MKNQIIEAVAILIMSTLTTLLLSVGYYTYIFIQYLKDKEK